MGRSGNVDGIGAVRMFPYKNRNWKSECHSAAPRSKSRHSSPPFVINPQTGIVYPEGNEKLQRTAEFLASYIKEATGITVRTTTEAARKNSIILAVDGSITNKEGYQLEVTSENIHLNGGSESGVFYGIQTLYKLCR